MPSKLYPTVPYTAAVIGGASGIGRALALYLAHEGVTVAIIDRRSKKKTRPGSSKNGVRNRS